jgi:hypothetical protein
MRFSVGAGIVASVILVSACQPEPYQSVDQARGVVIAATGALTFGPICEAKLSYFKFDLERAKDEEAQAIRYMKRHGQSQDQISDLQGRIAEAAPKLADAAFEAPDIVTSTCGELWQVPVFDRYKTGQSRDLSSLPPPVSLADVKAEDAENARADARLEVARKAASDAAAEANSAMARANSAMAKAYSTH